jgi:hypothetical protein
MATLGLRNITKEDEALLEGIGITHAAQFEKLGAEKTLLLLAESGIKHDHNLIYRLRGAERDIDWHILVDRAKRHAKSRFVDIDEP